MIFVGFALMVAHGYALGIEVAGFYACADPVYGNSLPEIQFRQ